MSRRQSKESVLPGSTIGILGGGQLARMTALAARAMGYRIHVLDPDPHCAAASVVDDVVVASFADVAAAQQLASHSDVVTYEIERIAPAVLDAVEERAILRPGASALKIVQDRAAQKSFLETSGFPVGPWRHVNSAQQLESAINALGPCRVKRTRGGYDGRSQARAGKSEEAHLVFSELAGPCVAEQELHLALELSVLVARSSTGEVIAYPPAQNWHREGILLCSVLPATIDRALERQATDLAVSIAEQLQMEGVLVVEMFVTRGGELFVNELAPRPHNTFHAAGECCGTSQFEQYTRAVCGLPLGSTGPHGIAVLINLLGDIIDSERSRVAQLLAIPGVYLHLYGKKPKPGRKIGHVVVRGSTLDAVIQRAGDAMQVLGLNCPFNGAPASPRTRPGTQLSVTTQ